MAKRSFDDMMNELEQIMQQLESGSLSLEEMMKLYSRGMQLTGKCRSRLDEARALLEPEEESGEEEE